MPVQGWGSRLEKRGSGPHPTENEVYVMVPIPRVGPPRDPSLKHQVVIEKPDGGMDVTVTCNCRKRRKVRSMGASRTADETRALYNDPKNHLEQFGEEWMLHGLSR